MLSDEQLADRIRVQLRAELDDVVVPPDLLDGMWAAARQHTGGRDETRRARPRRRSRRFTFGNVATAAAPVLAVVIALVALIGLQHHTPELPPIPTTDAVSNSLPASGALKIGAPAGPLHVPANTFQGAAIPSTVRLVAEAPDPHGGLPWGLREFRTTRGQTCVQVGRVQLGTIGVIGQDGAWGNDHRFHPISPNAYTGQSCSPTDAAGHAFNNVAVNGGGAIASANVPWGTGAQGGGCGATNGGQVEPPCPPQDLRNLNYGLLGPDAVSIDLVGAGGRRYTQPTIAPDGAYLIVTAPGAKGATCVYYGRGRGCSSGGRTAGSSLQSGVITQVVYRDRHTCTLPAPTPTPTPTGVRDGSCPPVGYARHHGPA
ncbi:MAG: hypothetical protein ACXVFQ_20220 [Solirubrobacteraceae bacterium]